ncbi:MAG: hypothetical protein QMC79_09725, partial [Anaerosomatales bacterium]|nr:hypothetical protein [Anaerosomatales bacterium]
MKTRIYVAALVTIAVALLIFGPWPPVPDRAWPGVVLLAALTILAESTAIRLPVTGSVSLALAFDLAALMYAGPYGGVVVALAGAVSPDEFRAHKEPIRMVFNAAQLSIIVLVGSAAYDSFGGTSLAVGGSEVAAASILPAILAAVAMQATATSRQVVYEALCSDLELL